MKHPQDFSTDRMRQAFKENGRDRSVEVVAFSFHTHLGSPYSWLMGGDRISNLPPPPIEQAPTHLAEGIG